MARHTGLEMISPAAAIGCTGGGLDVRPPTLESVRERPDANVITRMTELFVRTLREDPADAEVPSHRWLVRAGYVRRTAPGVYSWLPLGVRVLRKVETIVREEMDAMGAQEVHLP